MESRRKLSRADARRLAHELNNHLTVIHSNGEYLLAELERGSAAHTLREALGEIRGAVECAAGLTRELMDLAAPGDESPGAPPGRR